MSRGLYLTPFLLWCIFVHATNDFQHLFFEFEWAYLRPQIIQACNLKINYNYLDCFWEGWNMKTQMKEIKRKIKCVKFELCWKLNMDRSNLARLGMKRVLRSNLIMSPVNFMTFYQQLFHQFPVDKKYKL